MKLSTTTPASISLVARLTLIAVSILVVVAIPIQMTQKVFADQYDDKINALQQDISRYQAEGVRLNAESSTLQSALAQLANQKAAIQTQIDINQVKYDQLVTQIVETEQKIKSNQDALGKIIADLYVDDKITPIEMLASSNNISDYLDKQEYRSSVRSELSSTISKVKDLKKTLDTKKAEVDKVLTDQKSQRDSLAAKEGEQNTLLQKTQGQEAGYQQLIGSSMSQIAEARAVQAALTNRGASTGGYKLVANGSLPNYVTVSRFGNWNNSNCPMQSYFSTGGVDYSYNGVPPYSGQDGRGYGCRQCASYVAWRINEEKGRYPSWGDAKNFTSHGTPSAPRAGTVAVLDAGASGHVAWVETDPYISTSGMLQGQSVILVSQYNFDYGSGYGMYSVMELSVNFFDHYVSV